MENPTRPVVLVPLVDQCQILECFTAKDIRLSLVRGTITKWWQTMAKKRPRTVILHMNEMHGFHSILSSTCIVTLPPWQIPANITPINCLPGKSGRLYLPDLPSSCKTIQRIPHEIVLYMTSIIWLVVEPPFCKILYSQLGLFEIYRKMKMVQTT